MNEPRTRTADHLDAETLASFVDGRVNAEERARIEAHLATCEDCYEVFVETAAVGGELAVMSGPATVTTVTPRRRTMVPAFVGIAAVAASIALAAWLQPQWFQSRSAVDTAIDDLVVAVGTQRFTEARLSPDFRWGAVPSPVRGTGDESPRAVRTAAATLADLAGREKSAESLHGAGLAELAISRFTESIAALEESVSLAPDVAATRIDLAAALLERWRRDGSPADASRALAQLDAVQPGAAVPDALLFNRALALEATGATDKAKTAWQEYLARDSSSAWTAEARARLGKLTGLSTDSGR